ncbi:MAG TPA: LpxL/LpxP family Kdo(2)-lipid IV(A) lauroyl/palmitoleoyl acyltransferase [Gammaproteobacteria bacterium]|nr:LpxL/LpxP family Kdo(2)-lipid IV(A) lauroyl/palmitoleoyl acyltransferase [Gammaproteobacteria bacterium]
MVKGALQFTHPRYWLVWFGILLLWLISLLPMPVTAYLGRGLGVILYRVAGRRLHIARTNLELCFPELDNDQIDALIKAHFKVLGQAVLTIGINMFAPLRRLQRLVTMRDRHYFDRAIAGGRPVILLVPHFVTMEIAGLVLSHERSMFSMYQTIRNPLIDFLVRRGRSRFGGIMVERKADMRKVVKMMRTGSPFYYLPDQDPGSSDKVFAPFFGIQTAVTPGFSRFARLSKAVVIPCFTKMLPHGGGYEVIFLPPLKDFPTKDPVQDARRMNEAIEQGIREMPEQYFWVHRRFKSRPEGEGSLY